MAKTEILDETHSLMGIYRCRFVATLLSVALGLGLTACGEAGWTYIDLREKPPELGQDSGREVVWAEVGGELRRALPALPGSEHRWDLEVPEEASLAFSIGIQDQFEIKPIDAILFEVDVVVDGTAQTVFSQHLTRPSSKSTRRWTDVRLPLTSLGGQRVALVLKTQPAFSSAQPVAPGEPWAAWANPRIFVPRGEEDRRRDPNIILITVDTLRPDHLGCYGYERDTTPAIDSLAADGILFENAFTPLNRTAPAIASLMTGLYPRAHSLLTLHGDKLPDHHQTLAESLKELGYVTGALSAYFTSRHYGLHQGFDTYRDNVGIGIGIGIGRGLNRPEYIAEQMVAPASDWISARRDHKFFFWLHLLDPHFRDRGRRVSGPVMTMDVMPTALSVAGADRLPPSHGHDLVLYLDDDRDAHPVSFGETGRSFFLIIPDVPA